MSLREECLFYTDSDGLISPTRTVPGQRNASGNGVLYKSLEAICLHLRGELTPDYLELFSHTIRSCYVPGYPGLLRRGPVQPDQEAMDDYTGLLLASLFLGLPIAKEIYLQGSVSLPHYLYNNVTPGKFTWEAWLGRMPQFRAHLKACAGVEASFFEKAWSALTIRFSGKPGDPDSWLFSWMIIQSSKGRSNLCEEASFNWKKRLCSSHPGGMKEVVSACLSQDHPIAKFWPEGVSI